MMHFLALDGGGTTTECWVGTDKEVLAHVGTGSVKLSEVDRATATARLKELVTVAAEDAGISLLTVMGTCFGVAGNSSEVVRQWARTTLYGLVNGEVIICGDEEIAFEAAFRGNPGILVVAGTGSNVVGRSADRTVFGAGGWGPMLGDEGSGHWIGVEAIKAGLRAHDRGVDTCMLKDIQRYWKLRDQADLVAHANQKTRVEFSELAPIVAECADKGDALAASVLERAGQELAEQVSLVASKMHQSGSDPADAHHVALAGSILGKIPLVRRSMEEALRASMPDVVVAQEVVEPLEGAMWLARRRY